MEEQILKILEANTESEDVDGYYTADVTAIVKASGDISSHIHEFFDWCDGVDNREPDYLLQAYHHWLNNINNTTAKTKTF